MTKKKRKSNIQQRRKKNIQNYKHKTTNKTTNTATNNSKILKKFFSVLMVIITIASFIFFIYPRISLFPGNSLNRYKPFETPFIIKNDGYLPIYKIRYTVAVEELELLDGNKFIDCSVTTEAIIEKINPNKTSALFIDKTFVLNPGDVKYLRMYIKIEYYPFLSPFPFSEDIRFKTELNIDGEFYWFEIHENH